MCGQVFGCQRNCRKSLLSSLDFVSQLSGSGRVSQGLLAPGVQAMFVYESSVSVLLTGVLIQRCAKCEAMKLQV